jgi:hypothetical protein
VTHILMQLSSGPLLKFKLIMLPYRIVKIDIFPYIKNKFLLQTSQVTTRLKEEIGFIAPCKQAFVQSVSGSLQKSCSKHTNSRPTTNSCKRNCRAT